METPQEALDRIGGTATLDVRPKIGDPFETEPVPLKVFVEDRGYLGNPPLGPKQFDAVRHLEQIYLPETYDQLSAWDPIWTPVRFINFAWVQWGKGSGKDHICRVANARAVYLLQCLKSPQDYFGVPSQDWIHTLNVAASATQAGRAYFEPLRGMISHSPCFKGKYQTVMGEEPGKASMKFAKNLEMVSGHSKAATLEGLNIILGIADEISEFKTDEEAEHLADKSGRAPAGTYQSVLKMIRTSARTRFPRNFKLAAISYPRFKNDAIQQLTARGEADNEKYGLTEREWKKRGKPGRGPSRIYVSGPFPTWEVNPRVTSKEDFQEDYDEDPAMAEAMYECKPGLATNRFYRNDVALLTTFSRVIPEPVVCEYYFGKDEVPAVGESTEIPEEVDGWQVRFHFAPDFHPMQGALYSLHGDLAISGDRAGIAMAHVRERKMKMWNEDNQETEENRDIVKLDFVFAFEAEITAIPPMEVQLRWYRKLVWQLIARGFTVMRVTADGFQSADTLQILESRGIEAKVVSMDRNSAAWDNLRDVMYDGRLEAYHRPTVLEELQTLMRMPRGKVDHPSGGSKDEADALAGAILGAVEIGGSEGSDPQRNDGDFAEIWAPIQSSMGATQFGGDMTPSEFGGEGPRF